MVILVYDASMIGLLTCIFEVFEKRLTEVEITIQTALQPDAFATVVHMETDKTKAARVWKALATKVGRDTLRQFYYCCLSEMKGMENTLLNFCRYVFSKVVEVDKDYGNSAVLDIAQTARKVGREKHRMEAFVRFQLLKDNIYYSSVEPDFNVLPLIAKHFKSRYADQHWLIYDLKRKYGIYYDCVEESIREIQIEWAEKVSPGNIGGNIFEPGEEMYQILWKDYFKNTGIPERKNLKLHIQHVPKRYWKYLTEKQF